MTDTNSIGTSPSSATTPATDAPTQTTTGADRYELGAEIARGGMGVVVRARDRNLNRDLAVKLVHSHLADRPTVLRRFREEAEVLGQLQHPGIVPVHEVGTRSDGRPFFAMKLIAGRTLAELLRERPPGDAQLGRFLPVFESICQTVAFAHSRGFIHRDLKPANVMVGEFGEVQVMDWGLAKSGVGSRGSGVGENPEAGEIATRLGRADDPDSTVDHTAQPSTGEDRTTAGQVVGTPAFMPPEQARGETDRVGPPADVFALGGILCEILTAKPPFVGKVDEVLPAAQAGRLEPAWERLRASGADGDLIDLAIRCLQPHAAARPRDAGELAALVSAYRAGVEERMRAADRKRAEAEAEAREQRKRRKVQLALVGALGLLMAAGGAFVWWRDHVEGKQAAERERLEGERKVNEARLEGERDAIAKRAREGVATNLPLAVALRNQYRFKEAEAALAQAAELAKSVPELLPQVQQAQHDHAFVVALDDIRYRKWSWNLEEDRFSLDIASPEYRTTFATRGLDLATLDPGEAAKRIAASGVKDDLVAAIDDWALWAYSQEEEPLRNRLLDISRRVNPGPWLDRLRNPTQWKNNEAIKQLAKDANPLTASPASLTLLSQLMKNHRFDPTLLLSVARAHHPLDFDLAFAHGMWFTSTCKDPARPTREEALRQIGPYEAARSLRPDQEGVLNNLGMAYDVAGDKNRAIALYRELLKRRPTDPQTLTNLAMAMRNLKDEDGAIAMLRLAIKHNPEFGDAYSNLGVCLRARKQYDEAAVSFRMAIRYCADKESPHTDLGDTLLLKGQLDEAIKCYERAIGLNRSYFGAWLGLGVARLQAGDFDGSIAANKKAIELDESQIEPWNNLAAAHLGKRQWDEALAACATALRINPNAPDPHHNRGNALAGKGDNKGAIAAFEEAIKHDPKYLKAYVNLGHSFSDIGEPDRAIATYKRAIEYDRGYAPAHEGIGLVLTRLGKLDEAIEAYLEAVKHDPKSASAFNNLGVALRLHKKLPEAIEAFRKAVELDRKPVAHRRNLAIALGDDGNLEEAVAAFKQLIQDNPKSAQAHTDLGMAFLRKNDPKGAVEAFREAIRVDRMFFPAHHMLASTLQNVRDLDGAIAAYKEAITVNPRNTAVHFQLGIVLRDKRDLDGAIAAWREAIRLDQKLVAAHVNLGTALNIKNDLDGAAAAFREAIKHAPKHAVAHHNLGVVLKRKGELDGAITAYQEAIKHDPKYASAHLNLADIYLEQKKYPEAIACAREAIKVAPTYPNAHAMLGDLLRRTGDIPGARAALTEATRLDKQWGIMLARLPPIPVAPPPREVK